MCVCVCACVCKRVISMSHIFYYCPMHSSILMYPAELEVFCIIQLSVLTRYSEIIQLSVLTRYSEIIQLSVLTRYSEIIQLSVLTRYSEILWLICPCIFCSWVGSVSKYHHIWYQELWWCTCSTLFPWDVVFSGWWLWCPPHWPGCPPHPWCSNEQL